MEVKSIRKYSPSNGSKTVAFVDVDLGGVLIRSFRLCDFDGRYAIQPPSREATQKEKDKGFRKDYVFTCQFVDMGTQNELLEKALVAYNAA